MDSPALLVPAALVLTALLTGAVRAYALRSDLIDVPNERSSHDRPTPRGGGIAFAGVFLAAVLGLTAAGSLPFATGAALLGGGLLVAGVGWLDDRRSLSSRTRAAVHFLAAFWALAWLGGIPTLSLGAVQVELGPAGYLLGALGVVWLINLYNFMDGIDGLAGGEAVLVGGLAGALLWLGADPTLAGITWLLAASAAGFLLWNWAPARIFMGDVGSGFLGYTFAVLAVASEQRGTLPLLVWCLLLAVFLVDATATLARRLAQGERWYEAHRSHAYQRAVQAGHPHARVVLVVAALDLALGGLAWAAVREPVLLPAALVVAAGGLLLGWRRVVGPRRPPRSSGAGLAADGSR